MNSLCVDIGYNGLNKYREELSGDNIEVVWQNENSMVIVLADGLGSGVKANILSKLTAKIISTMMAENMKISDCVETIAATLPVCKERNVAYSTFTIVHIVENEYAEIIQYDNPHVILLRKGKHFKIPTTRMEIDGKQIYKSTINLVEDDIFILMSDGAIHAGVGRTLNFGWKRNDIIKFMETFSEVGFTAKTLTTILLDECLRLYGGRPGDDTTICTIKIRKRESMSLVVGPPIDSDDSKKMMALFFSKEGKHIVCGGTTSKIAAEYLKKELVPSLELFDKKIPPTAKIDGVDLVTEGIITINRVFEFAQDYIMKNEMYSKWNTGQDGASKICRLLFEEATDINFYVGKAINPAHQNLDLSIDFNVKMHLVEGLAECLKKMGKRIKISYF